MNFLIKILTYIYIVVFILKYVDKNLKRSVESDNRVADSTKAKKILKWKPTITFKKLVTDMVDSDIKFIENNYVNK